MNIIFTTPLRSIKPSIKRILLCHLAIMILYLILSSCSLQSPNAMASASAYSPSSHYTGLADSSANKSLNINSASSSNRRIVKTARVKLKAHDIALTASKLEQIVYQQGGFMSSLDERHSESQSADYTIHILAEHLSATLEKITSLGKVTYKRIYADDITEQFIQQTALLQKLKERRKRLKSLYLKAVNISDKLEVEKTLAEIEEQIFRMEAAISAAQKTAHYSKLHLTIKRARIRGPLGAISDGTAWTWSKLFTMRE